MRIAISILCLLYGMPVLSAQDSWTKLFDAGNTALRNDHPWDAKKKLERCLKLAQKFAPLDPRRFRAAESMGNVQLYLGSPFGASPYFERP